MGKLVLYYFDQVSRHGSEIFDIRLLVLRSLKPNTINNIWPSILTNVLIWYDTPHNCFGIATVDSVKPIRMPFNVSTGFTSLSFNLPINI